MKNVLDFSQPPLEELRYASESISTFASDSVGVISKMAGRLGELLPGIVSNFATSKQVGELANLKHLSSEEQKFLSVIQTASYAELRQLRADTPEGFVGDFLQYATRLHQVAGQLTNLSSQVLHPFTVFLGQLISSRNAGQGSDDRKAVYLQMSKERERGYELMGEFFPKMKAKKSDLIGDVAKRNGDWAETFQELKGAVDAINAVDRQQLTQLIAQAEDYLNIVHDMIAKGQLDGVTAATSRALAEGAFQIASQIEYYTVVHFRTLSLSNAVKGTVERVNRILG